MFPDEVFTERQQLLEKIATASGDFLQDNAAALMRIVWELQASLALELQIIQGIKRLDVSDAPTVADYVDRFDDYVERREFDLERTSCGRIANIYWQQIRALEVAPVPQERLTQLDELLQRFADADRRFTEEVEPFMDRALATLTAIRDAAVSGEVSEAKARQTQFSEEYKAEVQRLKSSIAEMTEVGQSLLARL